MDIVSLAWAALMGSVYIFSFTCSMGKEWALKLGILLI